MKSINRYLLGMGLVLLGFLSNAQNPGWTFDPSQFSNSMIVVGEIHVNKVKSEDVNDQVAAFINGELVGLANLRFESVADKYLALLSVYSNATSGTVSFKVYDSSADQVADVVTTLEFENNAVIGTGTTPYLWSNVVLNNEAKLLDISFPESYGAAVFSSNAVSAALRYGADVQALVPTLTLSGGAKAYLNDVEVINGSSEIDFSEALTLEIISEDEQHFQEYTVSVYIKNDAPSALTLDNSTISENNESGDLIGEFSATDDDQQLTYSLVSGTGSTGNASFKIEGNQLFAASSFNFESQTSYSIRVQVKDVADNKSESVFSIGIVDVNETPQSLSITRLTINENMAAGTVVGVLSAVDQDASETLTFSLTEAGADNDYFMIDGNQLKSAERFNFEEKSAYDIEIAVTDKAGNVLSKAFVVTIVDQNDAPTAIHLDADQILENLSFESLVGNVSVSDEDLADIHLLALVSGTGDTNNNLVYLSGTKLLVKSTIDYELNTQLSFRIKATDIKGASVEQIIVIDVIDILDSPIQLSNRVYPENAAITDTLGMFSIPEHAGSLTYTLAGAIADNEVFKIKGVYLTLASPLDYETKKSYVIRVTAKDDNDEEVIGEFSISIADRNDPPTGMSLSHTSVAENMAAGTLVGKFGVVDQDATDTYTYLLLSGDQFTIAGNELLTVSPLNFENKSKYEILVKVTDAGGLSFNQTFEISITDENDAPTDILLSSSVVQENLGYGTVIAIISTTDQDKTDSYEYSLVAGNGDTDNNLVFITGNTLMLRQPMDYEDQKSLSVRILSRDKGFAEISKAFEIKVKDVLDSDILIDHSRIPESIALGDTVGLLSVEDQTISFDYEFIDGFNDNDKFELMGDYVTVKGSFDYETRNLFYVDVSAKNNSNENVSSRLKIYISDVNEVATDLYLTKYTINENATGGGVVGLLKVTDADAGDAHTFNIVSDSENSDLFAIDEQGFLKSVKAFNFEVKKAYPVTIVATDKGGLKLEKVLTVNVVDQNDEPVYVKSVESFEMYNGYTNYIEIENSWFTDEDAADSLTYSIFRADGSAAPDWIKVTDDSTYLQFVPKGQGGNVIELLLVATDKDGASAMKYFDVTFLVISGTNELVTYQVYPNPATDIVTISGNIQSVVLYDLKGTRLILPNTASANQTSLDLRGLTKGVYLMQFEQNGQLIKTKIMKN